ncbi:hypothetical protein IC230_06410 [Spirosoma sp. BT704]|uniref:Uncharacterized protein n=2 Tax=Spirosoma validum TaxID=2771355 RepID=A0A927GC89_9BACT|nr:hypothetical protein [Spirosoma validum]
MALKDVGRVYKTNYILFYVHDPELQATVEVCSPRWGTGTSLAVLSYWEIIRLWSNRLGATGYYWWQSRHYECHYSTICCTCRSGYDNVQR